MQHGLLGTPGTARSVGGTPDDVGRRPASSSLDAFRAGTAPAGTNARRQPWQQGSHQPDHRTRGPREGHVAFLVAVGAAETGRPTLMFLTKEAVRLAVDGIAVGVACDGCPPLPDLMKRYEAAGGRYYVCPICFNAKQLDESDADRRRRAPGHGADVELDRRRGAPPPSATDGAAQSRRTEGSPNSGNIAQPKVVISAIAPSSIRSTSSLKARNTVSPGPAQVAGRGRHPVRRGRQQPPVAVPVRAEGALAAAERRASQAVEAHRRTAASSPGCPRRRPRARPPRRSARGRR